MQKLWKRYNFELKTKTLSSLKNMLWRLNVQQLKKKHFTSYVLVHFLLNKSLPEHYQNALIRYFSSKFNIYDKNHDYICIYVCM